MARDALPAYPAWMPIPRKEDYGYEPEDRRVITDTEVAQIRRPEYATDETVVQCSVMLSPLECAFFESFEHDILAQGSGWFTLPVLVSGQVSEHEACFASRPKFGKLHGCHITVTMELRLKSRDRMSSPAHRAPDRAGRRTSCACTTPWRPASARFRISSCRTSGNTPAVKRR